MGFFRKIRRQPAESLVGVHVHTSVQFLDFLELAENGELWIENLLSVLNEIVDMHQLNSE